MSEVATEVTGDKETLAIFRISPATWALIITLIVTLAGWGFSTVSTASELDELKQDVATKADEKDVERGYDTIIRRLSELQEDMREIRKSQQRDAHWHHPDRERRDIETPPTVQSPQK